MQRASFTYSSQDSWWVRFVHAQDLAKWWFAPSFFDLRMTETLCELDILIAGGHGGRQFHSSAAQIWWLWIPSLDIWPHGQDNVFWKGEDAWHYLLSCLEGAGCAVQINKLPEAKQLVAPCSVGNPRRCSCPPSLWALRYLEQLKSLAPDLHIEPDWRAGSGQHSMPTVAAAAVSLKSLLPSYSWSGSWFARIDNRTCRCEKCHEDVEVIYLRSFSHHALLVSYAALQFWAQLLPQRKKLWFQRHSRVYLSCTHTGRQGGREGGGQARQINRQAGRETDRQTEIHTDRNR